MNKNSIIESIQNISGVESISHLCTSPESDNLMVIEVHLRLSPEEVILRNYNALVSSKEINDEITKYDFVDKIKYSAAVFELSTYNQDKFNEGELLADLSLWLDSYALQYGIDLQLEKQAKMLKNEGL